MPILLLAWFFVLGQTARAAGEPTHLWHFDECEGNILKDSAGAEDLPQNAFWTIGKWQCAINQSWQPQYYIEKTFSAPLPAGDLTLSFYWRNSAFPNEGRNHLYLKNASGNVVAGIRPSIWSRTLYFAGAATSSIPAMPSDSDWHLITVTYSQSSAVLYVDGLPNAVFYGNYAMSSPISGLEIGGENWPVELDELAIWPRALSAAEVTEIYQAYQPLEPYTPLPPPQSAKIIHLWHFDEGAGATTADSAGATVLTQNAWWSAGKFGSGIEQSWQSQYQISQNIDSPIESKDLSIDFWWQNSSYPNEGRGSLMLQTSDGANVFGIRPSIYSGGYYFDGGLFSLNGIFPQDNAWHHLALVYDSYNFYLYFYVDGVEKMKLPNVWFRRPITKLVIQGENWPYKIDELAIWQGALSQAEIKDYYDSGKPHNATTQLEPVIIVPGIMGSWNVSGRWQIDPIFHTYDNLMEALMAAGYKEPSVLEPKGDLFTFPYDWRQDNNITANLLKQKIQEVKAITGASKVDIIAHSMGGLVTRSYVEGNDYQNDIDQVVFLGTPHQGSVDAYLRYDGAVFTGTLSWLQKYYFQAEADVNGYLDLTDYIRAQVPTVEQLLPVYSYLKDKQSDNSYQLRSYPLNYPQNNYLENLNSQANVDLLKQRVKITNMFSDLGPGSTLTSLRVVSDPNPSDNKWQNGYPENLDQNQNSLEMGDGDTTVPLKSVDSFNGVDIVESNSSDHMNLPTVMQKEIIKALTGKEPTDYFNSKITSTIKRWAFFRVYSPVDFLVTAPNGEKVGKNFASSTEINQIPDAFYSGFGGREEFVLIPNPADGEYKVEVQGVANGGEYTLANSLIDGNKETSKEFSGNITPGQQRDFNITYSAAPENPLGDLKPIDTVPPVITINKPVEGDKYPYSDNLVIDYTATDDFSGLASTTIILDGQKIATTSVKLINYALGQHNLIVQAVDKAGNQAQAQVNFTIIDNVPPIVTIDKPLDGDKYFHDENLVIDYSATDEFSGIASTTITIDGQAVATTTVDLFNYALGQHNLEIQAVDKAGNQARAKIKFEIIADVDSTISDINKVYDQGWLKDKTYQALLKDAFKLLKIEAKEFDKEQDLNEKLARQTRDDRKLTDKQKQKLIDQYDKKLADLKEARAKAIDKDLDLIIKLINKAKDKNQINQAGYDIILSDINYLRENL